MIRARSPFFLVIYGLAIVLGIGIAWIIFTAVPPSAAIEKWIKTPQLGQFRFAGWTLIGGSLGALTILGGIERAIYRGREPKWLRHRIPVCTVSDLYFHPNDPNGHRRIEVVSATGRKVWYILDLEEAFVCEVGDTIRLAAIGKYISEIQILRSSTDSPTRIRRTGEFDPLYEPSNADAAWTTMSLTPVFAGLLIGKGLEHLLFAEFRYWPSKRKDAPVVLATGLEAQVYGAIVVLLGVVIAVWCARMWLRGWHESDVSPEHVE